MKKNNLNKTIDYYINDIMKQVDKDINKAVNKTNNALYKEACDMYKKFIDDFYSYKTSSYIRHGESWAGTQEGNSLYDAIDIRKKTTWNNPSLSVFMPGDTGYNIGKYNSYKYEYDTPYEVVNEVVSGMRFPHYSFINNINSSWTGRYKGKFFQYEGTMKNAFDTFNNYFDVIARDIISKHMKKMGYY